MKNDSPISSYNFQIRTRPFSALAAQFFFPQRHCIICGEISANPGLCAACGAEQAALPRCDVCAAFAQVPCLCPQCAAIPPSFTRSRAAAPYGNRLRDTLHAFKYQEKTWLRRPLAALLTNAYELHYGEVSFSAVTPVPLASSRYKERGYNQSEMLSSLLAAEFGLDHQPYMLERVIDTPPLASYDGAQRRFLLTRAFKATVAAEGHTVLLVDDIYTSGATLNACAAALLSAGAREVYGLTVASYVVREKIEEFALSRANNIKCYIRTRKEKSE